MKNSQLIIQLPWFDLSISSKVKFYKVNWKVIYMHDLLYIYVFHENFVHTMYRLWYTTCWELCDLYLTFKCYFKSNVSMWTERLHMSSNWTFLALKMSDCKPFIFYDRIGFTRRMRHGSINFDSTYSVTGYYWKNIDNYGKWAKPDLSYLENYLLKYSIKSISWQLINITYWHIAIRCRFHVTLQHVGWVTITFANNTSNTINEDVHDTIFYNF